MEIRETNETGYITLAPIGELDANSSIQMDERLKSLVEQGKVNLHIDGSKLSYISSAGMGAFASYIDEINQQGGKMVFSNLSNNVNDVFELLGLTQIVTVVKDEVEVSPLF